MLLPPLMATTIFRKFFVKMGFIRYMLMANLLLFMAALPIKMVLRWVFNLKYIISHSGVLFELLTAAGTETWGRRPLRRPALPYARVRGQMDAWHVSNCSGQGIFAMPATEQIWRNPKRMHLVFAISSIVDAADHVWMLAADHHRDWKEFQRTFRDVETWSIESRIQQQENAPVRARAGRP